MEFRKDLFANERDDDLNEVGRPTQRQDALGHVTGRSRFFDDHAVPGMLHMKFARSPHHHARIRSMDVREAAQMPGVVRVLTSEDVPKRVHTLLILLDLGPDDEPPLAFDKVRYRGEPVAAVIAETESTAAAGRGQGCGSTTSRCRPCSTSRSRSHRAPRSSTSTTAATGTTTTATTSRRIRFGDVERAFGEADHVVEERYQMTPIEHAPTETGGCIAAPDTAGRYVCYTNTQALFFSLETAARILEVPSNRLHFVGGTVGGGFGGKVDSVHEPLAHPRRDAHPASGAQRLLPRRGDAGVEPARRGAVLHQGRGHERRPDRGPLRAASTATPAPTPG